MYASAIFDPPAIVDAVVQERCSALHGVPTHFYGVLAEFDRRKAAGEALDTRRLRTGIAAGSPIPIELMRRLIEQMGLTGLTNAYGMSEFVSAWDRWTCCSCLPKPKRGAMHARFVSAGGAYDNDDLVPSPFRPSQKTPSRSARRRWGESCRM